jgi:hypothetical protein
VRLDPRLPCDLDAILAEGDTRRRVRIVDLSRSGALVEVSPLPEIGTICRLQFELPSGDEPLIAAGTVVRQLTYECGVRFADLTPSARGELEKYLFVRTCVFGWFSYRRLFVSWQHLFATWLLFALTGIVLLFGGRELLAPMALPPAVRSGADLALVALTMAPFAFVSSLFYGLRLGPPHFRDALLYGRRPAQTLAAQIEAIRRSFGLSSVEVESLRDIHLANWRLPQQWLAIRARHVTVFVLIFALLSMSLARW